MSEKIQTDTFEITNPHDDGGQSKWSGQERQDSDGWMTNYAGETPGKGEAWQSTSSQTGNDEKKSQAPDAEDAPIRVQGEKEARRIFYTNFTEQALAKHTGVNEDLEAAHNEKATSSEHMRKQLVTWGKWVDVTHRVPDASARLICCPWAGGNSLAFDTWPARLPGVEVIPLLLPGRLTRAGECALTDISDVVATVVEALLGLNLLASNGMPCFVFGHELGALIAFEICRNVQAKFPVKALFVSGMTCPQIVHERGKLSLLYRMSPEAGTVHATNPEFEEAIIARGTLPPVLLENRDLFEIFAPLWLADMRAIDGYEYASGLKLECPIHCFGGAQDSHLELKGWGIETSSESRITLYPGGLFFLLDPDNEASMLGFLRQCIMNSTEEDRDTAKGSPT